MQGIDYKKMKAITRAAVIRGGYKLIELLLIKERMQRISAVEVIRPILSEDEATGKKMYRYHRTYDRIKFELDEMKGFFTAEVVDTPYNRKFLASHYGSGIFEIADKDVEAEIAEQAKSLTKQIIKTKAPEETTGNSGNKTSGKSKKKSTAKAPKKDPQEAPPKDPDNTGEKSSPKEKGVGQFEDS